MWDHGVGECGGGGRGLSGGVAGRVGLGCSVGGDPRGGPFSCIPLALPEHQDPLLLGGYSPEL